MFLRRVPLFVAILLTFPSSLLTITLNWVTYLLLLSGTTRATLDLYVFERLFAHFLKLSIGDEMHTCQSSTIFLQDCRILELKAVTEPIWMKIAYLAAKSDTFLYLVIVTQIVFIMQKALRLQITPRKGLLYHRGECMTPIS